MFERRNDPLLPWNAFLRRMIRHVIIAILILAGSLVLGIMGYHFLEGLPWIDALLNASMLLGGMGPTSELHTTAGKLFASFYAIYCGIVFIAVAGVLLAPTVHRFLHHFHMEAEDTTTEQS